MLRTIRREEKKRKKYSTWYTTTTCNGCRLDCCCFFFAFIVMAVSSITFFCNLQLYGPYLFFFLYEKRLVPFSHSTHTTTLPVSDVSSSNFFFHSHLPISLGPHKDPPYRKVCTHARRLFLYISLQKHVCGADRTATIADRRRTYGDR